MVYKCIINDEISNLSGETKYKNSRITTAKLDSYDELTKNIYSSIYGINNAVCYYEANTTGSVIVVVFGYGTIDLAKKIILKYFGIKRIKMCSKLKLFIERDKIKSCFAAVNKAELLHLTYYQKSILVDIC